MLNEVCPRYCYFFERTSTRCAYFIDRAEARYCYCLISWHHANKIKLSKIPQYWCLATKGFADCISVTPTHPLHLKFLLVNHGGIFSQIQTDLQYIKEDISAVERHRLELYRTKERYSMKLRMLLDDLWVTKMIRRNYRLVGCRGGIGISWVSCWLGVVEAADCAFVGLFLQE